MKRAEKTITELGRREMILTQRGSGGGGIYKLGLGLPDRMGPVREGGGGNLEDGLEIQSLFQK